MRRRATPTPTSPVRTCGRCGFTLPRAYFDKTTGTCTDCRGRTALPERVAAVAVDRSLRCRGALHLLNLGLPAAAAQVLEGHPWPSLIEARRMQERRAA